MVMRQQATQDFGEGVFLVAYCTGIVAYVNQVEAFGGNDAEDSHFPVREGFPTNGRGDRAHRIRGDTHEQCGRARREAASMLSPRRWSSATPGASDPPADQCIEVEFPSGALGIGFCDAIRHAAFSLQIEDFPRHAGVPGAAEAYSASVEAGSKLRQGMALVAINSNSCNCAGLDYDDTVALLKRARASGVSRLRFFGGVSSAAGEGRGTNAWCGGTAGSLCGVAH